MRRSLLLPVLALVLVCGRSAAQSFTEVPTPQGLSGIAAAPDGTVWCSSSPNRIYGFNASGLIADVPVSSDPIGGIVVGRDGALWFPGYRAGLTLLSRVTRTGEYSEFVLPRSGSLPGSIVVATDGGFWLGSGQLFHVTTTGAVTPYPIETYGVAPAPDGGAWFTTLSGPSVDAPFELRRISSAGEVTAFPQTRGAPGSTLSRLKVGPDGSLWASSGHGGEASLAHLDPTRQDPAEARTDFLIPGFQAVVGYGGAGINDFAPAPDGSVWFVTGRYVTGTGLHPGPGVFVAPSRVGQLSADRIVTQIDRVLPGAVAFAADGSLWFTEPSRAVRLVSEGCRSDLHALCLNGGRFRTQVAWRSPDGVTDLGTAMSLTPDTAAFWFFTANNIETVVKVVDGRNVSGHFWVFIGALTDVQWEMTVLDTETGAVRRYSNPQGSLQSLADTAAF